MNGKPFTVARIPLNNLTYWLHVIKICLKSVNKFSTIYNPNFLSRLPSYTCSLSIIAEENNGISANVVPHMATAPPTMPFTLLLSWLGVKALQIMIFRTQKLVIKVIFGWKIGNYNIMRFKCLKPGKFIKSTRNVTRLFLALLSH